MKSVHFVAFILVVICGVLAFSLWPRAARAETVYSQTDGSASISNTNNGAAWYMAGIPETASGADRIFFATAGGSGTVYVRVGCRTTPTVNAGAVPNCPAPWNAVYVSEGVVVSGSGNYFANITTWPPFDSGLYYYINLTTSTTTTSMVGDNAPSGGNPSYTLFGGAGNTCSDWQNGDDSCPGVGGGAGNPFLVVTTPDNPFDTTTRVYALTEPGAFETTATNDVLFQWGWFNDPLEGFDTTYAEVQTNTQNIAPATTTLNASGFGTSTALISLPGGTAIWRGCVSGGGNAPRCSVWQTFNVVAASQSVPSPDGGPDWLATTTPGFFADLFTPSQQTLERFSSLKDTLSTKPPFGYFSAISDALASTSTSTPAFTLPDAAEAALEPIRTGISWVLWLLFGFWILHRVRHMEL